MAKSSSQIIGLDTGTQISQTKIKPLNTKLTIGDTAQKPEDSALSILSYLKSKITKNVQLGNIIEESKYYGLGIDYELSKVLSFYVDITANIDPKTKTYITAQQASFNFIYRK